MEEQIPPQLRHSDPNDRSIKAPWEHGKPVYRASMAGSCPRELLLHRIGIEPVIPSQYAGRGEIGAREGSLHEAWIVDDLIRQGYEVIDHGEGDEQATVRKRYKRYVVRSHPDGKIRGLDLGDTWHVLECKALNQDGYARWRRYGWEGYFKYACQVSLEMWLSGCPALFIVKNRNTGEMDKLVVTEPPVSPEELIRKFSTVEDLALLMAEDEELDVANLPECGEDAEWYFCPFFGDGHCEVRVHVEKNNLVVEDEIFEGILARYDALKQLIKEMESEVADLRTLIDERMPEPRIRVGDFFTSFSDRTRKNFDWRAAEQRLRELGEDTSQFHYTTSYRELRVTKPKGRSADQEDLSGE